MKIIPESVQKALLNKALEGLELLFDRATGGKYAA